MLTLTKIHRIANRTLLAAMTICTAGAMTGCSDWLDVKPDNQQREVDMFSKSQGYMDALTGCYASLAKPSVYGKSMTMTDVECLANQWAEPSQTTQPSLHYLHNHVYDNDDVKTSVKNIYQGLYNAVAQANVIINHVTTGDGNVISDNRLRNAITGEAYAIRALCHMDVLRLFGQMPQNATKQVSLPYSEDADISVIPAYYNLNAFVAKLESDLNNAEKSLIKSDPWAAYDENAPELESSTSSTYIMEYYSTYRNMRLNYWAVKALKARLYLYLGRTADAYREAKAVLAANKDGKVLFTLSSRTDYINGYYAAPSECIFALSVDGLGDYAVSTLGGDVSARLEETAQLHLTQVMFNQLFTANTSSDVRYINLWEQTKSGSITYPTIKKYFYDSSATYDAAELLTKREIVPMLRLSEMYLILIETTNDLTEANSLYKEYMRARNVSIATDFASLDDAREEVKNEYLRDFYAEGQMFFVYKRLAAKKTFWVANKELGEDQYILPMPSSEYDPATK